jgi:hypothetical protein
MVYLYIDESGDLGFNEKGSKYFVLSCVKIEDENTNKHFNRIPKKIRQTTLTKKWKKHSELKFSNSSVLIRQRFLNRVAKLDLEIFVIIIEKKYTKKQLQENLPILYNYLIKVLMEQPIESLKKPNKLEVYLDKCMSQGQRENFEQYVKTEFLSVFKSIPRLNIKHKNSHENGGLQVTDFVCGAFGYKYNTAKLKGDFEIYTGIVKNKVMMEKNDLFKKK